MVSFSLRKKKRLLSYFNLCDTTVLFSYCYLTNNNLIFIYKNVGTKCTYIPCNNIK